MKELFNYLHPDNALSDKIDRNAKILAEVESESAAIDRESTDFFQELEVTPEQVAIFLSDETNFSPENWATIQNQSKELQEKLERRLNEVHSPRKRKPRAVQNHWLFVR